MITILLQKILAALTQLLGDIKTKLNTIKDNLDDLIVVATASGPIASFTTTITKPLISCSVEIKPKQASGTPTPSNPLPISGTDTVVITQTDVDNQVITTKTVSLPETVYGGEVDVIGGSGESTWASVDLSQVQYTTTSWGAYKLTIDNCKPFAGAIVATCKSSIYNTTSYNDLNTNKPNNTIAIATTGNVYIVSDNPPTGQLVFELQTPTPITLANPIELTAINGVNNVFGDTDGNTTVEYLKLYKEV